MEKTKYIVTDGISQYLYYCKSNGLSPAEVKYLGNFTQLKRVPVGTTVILYGVFRDSPIYPDVEKFRESGHIKTQVVMPK